MVGAGAGAGAGAAVIDDDTGGDGLQCSDHPYRTTSPGGICAFCLQEKLGKLVSSSSSSFFIGSSSSSSPSFRSDKNIPSATSASSSLALSLRPTTTTTALSTSSHSTTHHQDVGRYYNGTKKGAKIPFLLTQKKKKKPSLVGCDHPPSLLKRSKSTATPRSGRYFGSDIAEDYSPRRRGFWSFLHLSTKKGTEKSSSYPNPTSTCPGLTRTSVLANPAAAAASSSSVSIVAPISTTSEAAARKVEYVVVDEPGDSSSSPNSSGGGASFGRKVSRSRSVGCGSRSFSGDFFERISTGFGDCTLRRVESQREGSKHRHSTSRVAGDVIKERVRCGGLFGGFMMITSSSSSSSSSSYWVSSNSGEEQHNGRPAATPSAGPLIHGRSRSWGWAFASPMRAFNKPSTTTIKDGHGHSHGGGGASGGSKNSNGTTSGSRQANLGEIPSLLAVRS